MLKRIIELSYKKDVSSWIPINQIADPSIGADLMQTIVPLFPREEQALILHNFFLAHKTALTL